MEESKAQIAHKGLIPVVLTTLNVMICVQTVLFVLLILVALFIK